jgi:hypothetical protein
VACRGKGGLPKPLGRLLRLVRAGLEGTAALWPPIQTAYGWVRQAAHLLANHEQRESAAVQQAYQDLLHHMAHDQARTGSLNDAVAHFRTVSASYWPGLFCCYDVPDLPRTNNDLEQYFGAARHLERRATGRKGASPAMVIRGAVRVVATVAAHLHPMSSAELRPSDLSAWRTLRQTIDSRHTSRRMQARFRRAPATYLAALEDRLIAKPVLPS